MGKIHVGGREQALARAQELRLSYRPRFAEGSHSAGWGRDVFRLCEASWLVDITSSYWSGFLDESVSRSEGHFRITVAELVTTQEPTPAEPGPPQQHGRLRRALGG